MSKSSSNTSWIKLATVLMPVVAVLAAGFLIFLQVTRLRSLGEQQTKTENDLVFLNRLSQEIKNQPTLNKIAAIPPALNEQSLFLDMIRKFADQSQVHLVRYTNRVVPAPSADSPEAKKNALPPGVLALTSDVEVSGNYNGIRQFLYQLLHSPRLYNTTDLRWSRGTNTDQWPITHLTFTLLRYVETPIIAPAKPAGDNAAPLTNS